jgi:hypothetical protein
LRSGTWRRTLSPSRPTLLELARHATAAQLERTVRAARRASTADADELERQAFVRWHWDDDGSLRVEAKLAPADGAQVLRSGIGTRRALRSAAG